jgi:hypothetical protein
MSEPGKLHWKMRNVYKILFRNLKERDYMGVLGTDGRVILKWILVKYYGFSLVDGYHCFGGTCCFHFQMKIAGSHKMVLMYQNCNFDSDEPSNSIKTLHSPCYFILFNLIFSFSIFLSYLKDIVTWCLQAGMVESEKMLTARQQLVKNLPAATNYCGNRYGTKSYPW